MNENNVNVEQIMSEIRNEIKEKGLNDNMLSFIDVPIPEEVAIADIGDGPFDKVDFLDANKAMNRTYQVSIWHKFSGNKFIQLLKRGTRKLIRSTIEPIVNDQNTFNLAVARSINELRNLVMSGVDGKKTLIEQIDDLTKRVDLLEKENNELKEKLSNKVK